MQHDVVQHQKLATRWTTAKQKTGLCSPLISLVFM